MRGFRGRAGDGYGAPGRETTRAKYLGMQVLGSSIFSVRVRTQKQGYMGELGPPLGPGSRTTWEGTWASPAALLLGPLPGPVLSCPA